MQFKNRQNALKPIFSKFRYIVCSETLLFYSSAATTISIKSNAMCMKLKNVWEIHNKEKYKYQQQDFINTEAHIPIGNDCLTVLAQCANNS